MLGEYRTIAEFIVLILVVGFTVGLVVLDGYCESVQECADSKSGPKR